MVGQGSGKPVALSTTCQGECSSGGRHLTFICGQMRPPGLGLGPGIGAAPRATLVVLGRVERPRSTAADQGWSALPWTPAGSRSPFACWRFLSAYRQPPTAVGRSIYFPSAALIDFATALPSVADPSALKCTSALFWCCARVGVMTALRSSMATAFSFMTLRAISL